MDSHEERIRDQFTKQAVTFSEAPAIKDEETLQLLVDFTGAGPHDTLLDVACGPGLVVCAFAGVVRHATGIDLTPAMIERAREIQREKGLSNVTLEVGDVLPLPYPDRSFSIVVSRYAFHHFLDPRAVLAEMRRVCRPGGKVAVVDVAASSDPRKAALYNRMEKLRDASHVRALTLGELVELYDLTGLPPPRTTFYSLRCDLEGLLQRSFPEPGCAEEVRRIIKGSLEGDTLGMSTHRNGEEIRLAYPIAVLTAERTD